MADTPKMTTAQIKRLIEEEVSRAFKTQLADSSNRVNPVRNQFGPAVTISIDKFTLSGVLIPGTPDDKRKIAALEQITPVKPKSKKKKKNPPSPPNQG